MIKILILINWKIEYCNQIPQNKQPSDYCCPQEKFWMFKYFNEEVEVDVVDIQAPKWIELAEKKIHFHIYQTLKILKDRNKYDLILVHGSDSAMLIGAVKRVFRLKTPPIVVVDISSFHQADTKGIVHRLCQFSSKAFDHLIYHTSSQKEYFEEQFPWLLDKATFIPVGVDFEYWQNKKYKDIEEKGNYIVCVGYRKRDWNTLIQAYKKSGIQKKLYLIGNPKLTSDDENICILPFMPIDELMEYIYNASFSVIPLDDFNYSFAQLTILQQMALGIPIIAADVPALRDYIQYSDGVVSYKPYDVTDLTGKMQVMLDKMSREEQKMRLANQNAIKNVLNERKMAIEFERVCRSVVKL